MFRYGNITGKLSIEFTDLVHPTDLLRFHPEFVPMLEAIKKEGWSCLFIETKARAVSDFDVAHHARLLEDGNGFSVEIRLGDQPPPVTGMPEVLEFRINISTMSFPRAATIDLSKGVVTYFHDAFWEWKEEWKNDPTKLSEAKQVYDVAKWLLDVKKMKLRDDLGIEHFRELSKTFQALFPQKASNASPAV
jgi:hypothetical protein